MGTPVASPLIGAGDKDKSKGYGAVSASEEEAARTRPTSTLSYDGLSDAETQQSDTEGDEKRRMVAFSKVCGTKASFSSALQQPWHCGPRWSQKSRLMITHTLTRLSVALIMLFDFALMDVSVIQRANSCRSQQGQHLPTYLRAHPHICTRRHLLRQRMVLVHK